MLRVRIRYFGQAREAAGLSEEEMMVEEGVTLRDVMERIFLRYGGLAAMRDLLRVAVNRRLADLSSQLSEGDEVALLPPVSGGCHG